MNAFLKTHLVIFSAVAALGTNMARAQENPAPQVSRAEVLADLQIWRESGLAQEQSGDAIDPQTHSYREALARYEAMRSSPQFAELVARISRQRSERGLIAQQ